MIVYLRNKNGYINKIISSLIQQNDKININERNLNSIKLTNILNGSFRGVLLVIPGYVKMLKIMLHATSGNEAASLVVIFLGMGKHRSS